MIVKGNTLQSITTSLEKPVLIWKNGNKLRENWSKMSTTRNAQDMLAASFINIQ